MLSALRIRQTNSRVALLVNGKLAAELAAEEAVELATAMKVGAQATADGWFFVDGRLKVGKAIDRVAVLIDGKLTINCPQTACLLIAGKLREAGKHAEHWQLLNHTKPRERLYADQELLIGAGLPFINLGTPASEFRVMGGMTAHRGPTIGIPSLIASPPKPALQRNGHDHGNR